MLSMKLKITSISKVKRTVREIQRNKVSLIKGKSQDLPKKRRQFRMISNNKHTIKKTIIAAKMKISIILINNTDNRHISHNTSKNICKRIYLMNNNLFQG